MAILIALAFGLLFLLIAMVVNIGFLVAAKINLQNATDLAAYAGAAQQARYLSEIGKWNYEMRRNYKAMAYDYMIVLNGERRHSKVSNTDRDFRDYIITGTDQPKGVPWACASLQRQGANVTPGNQALEKLCQNSDPVDFQSAITNSANALTQSLAAVTAACGGLGDYTTCMGVTAANTAQNSAHTSVTNTAHGADDKFANYEKQPYNYNRRLIAWMLHDYRHLQTRIRGVHFGSINIGSYAQTNGRWSLQKDQNPTVFLNSPISVAAKVLNGYTKTDGTATTSGVVPIKSDNGSLNNPVNNAAYGTFKKNLMEVLYNDAKLYSIVPKSNPSSNSSTTSMVAGCGGACPEFNGPYLKLDNHDVDFWVTYTTVLKQTSASYKYDINMEPVTRFPVGVAKDQRVGTYYTVVGTAITKNIPFNVFFGGNETSQDATMVAVAAARPFGSRIGPYIKENCENLAGGNSANQGECVKNGLDPLYPFQASGTQVQDLVPNFSVSDDTSKKLGVKLCVDKTEYAPVTSGTLWGSNPALSSERHTVLYQKGSDQNSRWRVYTKPNDMNSDDGFATRPSSPTTNPSNYFDSDANPVHPFGTRDSVMAWSGKTTVDNISAAERDNYEGYLDKYRGAAVYQFGEIPDRTANGQKYKIYVFRYPDIDGGTAWDIKGKTKGTNSESKMETSFANAMAVSIFEAARYILPYRNDPTNQSVDQDVMNYTVKDNGKPFLFGGVKDTEAQPIGLGNIKFAGSSPSGSNNIIKEEPAESLGSTSPGDVFPETYAAWRFGSRGYRVKLVNIQDLITSSTSAKFQNPLEKSYTLPDGTTIDLSSIQY